MQENICLLYTSRDCITNKDYDSVNKNQVQTSTTFKYVQQGTYYAYCHAWKRDENGKKVFSDWSGAYPFVVSAITPDAPVITNVTAVSYTHLKCGRVDVETSEYTVEKKDGKVTVTAKKDSKNYTGSKTVDAATQDQKPAAPMISSVKVVGNKATAILSGCLLYTSLCPLTALRRLH